MEIFKFVEFIQNNIFHFHIPNEMNGMEKNSVETAFSFKKKSCQQKDPKQLQERHRKGETTPTERQKEGICFCDLAWKSPGNKINQYMNLHVI